MKTLVSSAPKIITLIETVSAVKFKDNANNSICKKASVKDAMKDIKSSMVDVNKSISTLPQISDAPSGLMEFVPNAQEDGILTLKEFVSQ